MALKGSSQQCFSFEKRGTRYVVLSRLGRLAHYFFPTVSTLRPLFCTLDCRSADADFDRKYS